MRALKQSASRRRAEAALWRAAQAEGLAQSKTLRVNGGRSHPLLITPPDTVPLFTLSRSARIPHAGGMSTAMPGHGDLLQLKRWNTPTIYNGWEQITRRDAGREGINLEKTRDSMPQMGPMIGFAVTLVVEPAN